MDYLYQLNEKVGDDETTYVPVSMELEKYSDSSKYVHPFQMLSATEDLEKISPLFLVIFIKHTGEVEQDKAYFANEEGARKYIEALGKAISMKSGVKNVQVHYNESTVKETGKELSVQRDSGKQDLQTLLRKLPLNTYTSFRTPQDTFSMTLAKLN